MYHNQRTKPSDLLRNRLTEMSGLASLIERQDDVESAHEAGTYVEALDSTTVGLLPWVRAKLVLAGGTNFGAVATVEVVSTGSFTLSSS